MKQSPRISPLLATVFAGLAVILVFVIATLWEFWLCRVIVCEWLGLDKARTNTEHWNIVITATVSASASLLALAPFALRVIHERNRAVEEVNSQSIALQDALGKELSVQHDRFDLALENLIQGVCMFDAEQRLIVSNGRYASMYDLPADLLTPGVTLREILEHRIAKGLYAEASPEDYIRERMAWVSSGQASSKVQKLSDGRSIAIVHQPLPDGGWLTTHEDITARTEVQTELEKQYHELQNRDRKLREQNERFDAALNNMSQGLCMFDGEQRLIVSNRRYADMYGLSQDKMVPGITFREVLELRIHNEVYAGYKPEEYIQERMEAIAEREASHKTQTLSDGRTILISHCPMADGGWLATHEDITERKKSSDLLRAVIDSFPGGIAAFDENLILRMANKSYYQVLGLPEDQFAVGARFEDGVRFLAKAGHYGPVELEHIVRERIAMVRTRDNYSYERHRPDGSCLEVQGFRLPEGGFVCTYVDVTERKTAEQALRESEELFSKVFQSSPAACTLSDPHNGKHYDVNETWIKLLGYSREEAMAHSALELGVWDDSKMRRHFIEQLKKKGSVRTFEAKFRTKDGKLLDFLVSGEFVDVGGQSRLLVVSHDVTERKRVEEALQQSEELFSKAFQANPIPFSISKPDGTIYDLNEAWLTTMGYTREEAIGNSAITLGIWADPDERARFVELIKTHGAVAGYETRYRTRNGDLIDMVVSGEYVDVGGEPRMFNLSHDVTESNRAKQQLLEHRDHLQELVNEATAELKTKAERLEVALAKEKQLNELQRQFVSMASHEFRTPLAVIDGLVQRLIRRKDKISPEDLEARALKIRGAVQTITNLMESTLSAARMDAGKIEINITPHCDLGAIITEVCASQRQIGKRHKMTCDLRALPAAIAADGTALNQVFTNLVSNASKYSPEGSEITVKGWRSGDTAFVAVQDKGLGIDADDLPKMFTRFFRARTSTGIPGTGIGLNIVKALVELHGGSITVQSERGVGSVFTVRLPVAGPPKANPAKEAAA